MTGSVRGVWAVLLGLACVLHASIAMGQGGWLSPVPGLRVDAGRGVVEFEGEVAIEADPTGRLVDYIELFVCSWDSREHESLVVTRVKPSDVHAALLVAGGEPGEPASFDRAGGELVRTPARGTGVTVEFVWREGEDERVAPPEAWVRHVETGETLAGAGFVFAGSAVEGGRYIADEEGTLVSLVVFERRAGGRSVGIETVAYATPISAEASVDETVWVADAEAMPPAGTPVTVRVTVLSAAGPEGDRDSGAVPLPEGDLDGLTEEE